MSIYDGILQNQGTHQVMQYFPDRKIYKSVTNFGRKRARDGTVAIVKWVLEGQLVFLEYAKSKLR